MNYPARSIEPLEPRRMLAAGALDPFFGDGGTALTSFPRGSYSTTDMRVLPNGSIVVAGSYSFYRPEPNVTKESDTFIAHYRSDGSLDTRFGAGGIITLKQFGQQALVPKLSPDGRSAYVMDGRSGGLVRVNANTGATDMRFGTLGVAKFGNIVNSSFPLFAVSPIDGSIILMGKDSPFASEGQLQLARLTSNGKVDKSFGTRGDGTIVDEFDPPKEAFDAYLTEDNAIDVAFEPNGNILVAGRWVNLQEFLDGDNEPYDVIRDGAFIVRYDAHGKKLASNSKLVPSIDLQKVNDIALTADGKIIAADANFDGLGAIRLNNDLSLDTTFAGDGVADIAIAKQSVFNSTASRVMAQADGKVLVLGSTPIGPNQDYHYAMALARFNVDGSPDASFGNNGVIITDVHATDDEQNSGSSAIGFALANDGSIVVAGSAVSHASLGLEGDDLFVTRHWRDAAPAATARVYNIRAGSPGSQKIVVTYRSDQATDVSTLGNRNLRVTGPNGYVAYARFISSVALAGGKQIIATYKLAAPADGWSVGGYALRLRSGQIADTAANFIVPRTIGSFDVV